MKIVVNGRNFDVISATGTSDVTFIKRSNRMMMYSERVPDLVDFQRMLKVAKFGYSFPKASRALRSRKVANQFLTEDIHRMKKVWAADPSGFDSVCLATYGPGHIGDDASGWPWHISEEIFVNSLAELQDRNSPVRKLLEALGNSTKEEGEVHLLSCPQELYTTDEGKNIIKEIEDFTATTFSMRGNVDPTKQNPCLASKWDMTSDSKNIRGLYFKDFDDFDCTLEPEQSTQEESITINTYVKKKWEKVAGDGGEKRLKKENSYTGNLGSASYTEQEEEEESD